jgi:membrane protein YdbS with pleckstrin-like domain
MSAPGPQRRLGRTARTLWRLQGLGTTAGAAIAAAVAASAVGRGWFSALAWAAVALVAVALVGVAPELRWRRWRWDVGEDDVEIRSGTLTVTHTIVPLRRVQHVDTQRGILEQALGLATVALHTAAGANRIPALGEDDAAAVRDRIAALTRTADEL